jgi:type I restriction enzyme S subunit
MIFGWGMSHEEGVLGCGPAIFRHGLSCRLHLGFEKATQCVAFLCIRFFGEFGRSESDPPKVILERFAGLVLRNGGHKKPCPPYIYAIDGKHFVMRVARLGDHVRFLSGFAFKAKDFNNEGRGLPVVRIRDVVRGYSETFFPGKYKEQYLVRQGDYLIGMDGEFNLARWQSGTALLNQRVCKIDSISKEIVIEFLARYLSLALKKIEDSTSYVTVKHLSVKKLNEIGIPLPPLPEQKRIAAILDAADALRAKRRESIAQLDALVQSTFLQMFGDPVTNPKGWEVKTSGDLFQVPPRIGTTKPASNRGFLVVRVGEVGQSRIAFSRCQRVEIEEKDFNKFKLEPGDIVIARAIGSKNQLGKASYFHGFKESIVIDSHVMRFRPDPLKCEGFWLYSLLSSERGKLLLQRAGGATTVQFN